MPLAFLRRCCVAGGVAAMAALADGASRVLALWALAGFVITQHVLRANRPMELPTASFLRAGTGRVLDLGAGRDDRR